MRGSHIRAAVRAVALAVYLPVACSAQAATYSVRVVSITDGDTPHALYEGREIIVRLRWIDAPEKGQPFGDGRFSTRSCRKNAPSPRRTRTAVRQLGVPGAPVLACRLGRCGRSAASSLRCRQGPPTEICFEQWRRFETLTSTDA